MQTQPTAAKPNGSGKRVLQEAKSPEKKPDLSGPIRQLLKAGHSHEDIVHILAARRCSLMDVHKVHKAMRDAT